MLTPNKIVAITLAAVLMLPLQANELPAPLAEALANLKEQASNEWAYSRESWDKIGHYTERFDPTLPKEAQWQLVSFDDKEPLQKHFDLYRENNAELSERDSPTEVDFSTLIDPATVLKASESETEIEYSFNPLAKNDEDKKIVPHLKGSIIIDKGLRSIIRVNIANTRKIKPVAMVSIKTLHMSFTLAPVRPNGPVFVVATESLTEGRFMGIKRFSEQESVKFRDFTQTP